MATAVHPRVLVICFALASLLQLADAVAFGCNDITGPTASVSVGSGTWTVNDCVVSNTDLTIRVAPFANLVLAGWRVDGASSNVVIVPADDTGVMTNVSITIVDGTFTCRTNAVVLLADIAIRSTMLRVLRSNLTGDATSTGVMAASMASPTVTDATIVIDEASTIVSRSSELRGGAFCCCIRAVNASAIGVLVRRCSLSVSTINYGAAGAVVPLSLAKETNTTSVSNLTVAIDSANVTVDSASTYATVASVMVLPFVPVIMANVTVSIVNSDINAAAVESISIAGVAGTNAMFSSIGMNVMVLRSRLAVLGNGSVGASASIAGIALCFATPKMPRSTAQDVAWIIAESDLRILAVGYDFDMVAVLGVATYQSGVVLKNVFGYVVDSTVLVNSSGWNCDGYTILGHITWASFQSMILDGGEFVSLRSVIACTIAGVSTEVAVVLGLAAYKVSTIQCNNSAFASFDSTVKALSNDVTTVVGAVASAGSYLSVAIRCSTR